MLTSAFPSDIGETMYIAGVYFTSFERIGTVERPFLDAVIHNIKSQHDEYISWTKTALSENRRCYRFGAVYLFLSTSLMLLAAFLLFLTVRRTN